MIAILVAVKQELRPILRRAKASHVVRQQHLDFYEGTFGGLPVALLALGVGMECARIAAEMTIKCYRPDLVISAGFGGGLCDSVKAGDIVIGTEILDLLEDYGDEIRWRLRLKPSHIPRFNVDPPGLRLHYGKLITKDEIVLKSSTKTRIGKTTGALSVDMETSAVAAVAAAHQTDFLAVRCIIDTSRDDMPEDFNDFFVLGQLRPDRVLSACVRDPRIIGDLARLGYRAKKSGNNLARFLEAALPQLHLPALAARNL